MIVEHKKICITYIQALCLCWGSPIQCNGVYQGLSKTLCLSTPWEKVQHCTLCFMLNSKKKYVYIYIYVLGGGGSWGGGEENDLLSIKFDWTLRPKNEYFSVFSPEKFENMHKQFDSRMKFSERWYLKRAFIRYNKLNTISYMSHKIRQISEYMVHNYSIIVPATQQGHLVQYSKFTWKCHFWPFDPRYLPR